MLYFSSTFGILLLYEFSVPLFLGVSDASQDSDKGSPNSFVTYIPSSGNQLVTSGLVFSTHQYNNLRVNTTPFPRTHSLCFITGGANRLRDPHQSRHPLRDQGSRDPFLLHKMTSVRNIKLNSGTSIPAIGLGVWAGRAEEDRRNSKSWVGSALKAGYRHIDTGLNYGTEKFVGEAIRESGVPREEIFVTTKFPPNHHGRIEESLDESLRNTGLDYIDLYLVHWPQHVFYEEGNSQPLDPDGSVKTVDTPDFNDSWAVMEKLLATGKVRAIGVSNFSIKTLEQLLKTAKVAPAVNQVELHPYLAQNGLVEYCKKKGIILTAYAPTGYSSVREDPLIVELAGKYKVSPAQIILAWHLSRGTVVVPKSSDVERQKENINLPTLDEVDLKHISGLDRGERLCESADKYGEVYGWTYDQLGW